MCPEGQLLFDNFRDAVATDPPWFVDAQNAWYYHYQRCDECRNGRRDKVQTAAASVDTLEASA